MVSLSSGVVRPILAALTPGTEQATGSRHRRRRFFENS
ncbi:hypothetical protein KPATCC21470_0592 [Kitasatospora purpeofusca]